MYFYKAFGIRIKSAIEVPQFLVDQSNDFDVSIEFGNVQELLPEDKRYEHLSRGDEGEIIFYWEQIGWYLIKNGDQIIIDPIPNADQTLVLLPLLGVVMAVLLQQRGKLVLHASAVSINQQAAIFVGWKGQGKSTTAAMLYDRGHPMISDDVVLLEVEKDGNCSIIPGFPNFKLLPETVAGVLKDNPLLLAEIYPGAGKRFRTASDNFLAEPVPVKAIFSLETGDEFEVERLDPQRAIAVMIANTYSARYGKHLLQNSEGKENLLQCSKVVNRIPLYRLQRPKSFELLDQLADVIKSHC